MCGRPKQVVKNGEGGQKGAQIEQGESSRKEPYGKKKGRAKKKNRREETPIIGMWRKFQRRKKIKEENPAAGRSHAGRGGGGLRLEGKKGLPRDDTTPA